jgi:DNA-binding MarR family transcriptional regulator
MDKYDCLKLDNQLCFPLYVASKELVRRYKPFLDKIDLTYTQYIAMMVMWEKKKLKVTELCKCLYLDTGTISPLVRKLKSKGYITLTRDEEDERIQIIEITSLGEELKEKALNVPQGMMKNKCIDLSVDEAICLKKILNKIINN